MKLCKIICALGTLATLSSPVNAFDVVSTHIETRYGTVVRVEPIWDMRTNYRRMPSSSCSQTNLLPNNLERTLLGAAIGSAVGNELSEKDGMGSIGAFVGAVIASDSIKKNRTCAKEIIYEPVQERTLSHYLVEVKIGGETLQFETSKSYELYDQLPFRVETKIKPLISGINSN